MSRTTEVRQPSNDNSEEVEAARSKINRMIDSGEYTASQLANEIDIDRSTFSRWRKGTYQGNNDKIDSKVLRFLDSREVEQQEPQLPEIPGWVETPTGNRIKSALRYAHMARTIACIYGGAGNQKTATIKAYKAETTSVWHVTVTPASSRQGALLVRIAHALNLRGHGRADEIERSIVERIRNSRGLLVIDEAQHCPPNALDSLRAIQEEAGIGLALAGNEIVYAQMTGGQRTVGFAQLFSRIAKRVRVERPLSGDIDAILDAWGLEDATARKACHHIGRQNGALRGLTHTLSLATMFAQGNGETVGRKHIEAAFQDLGGEGVAA